MRNITIDSNSTQTVYNPPNCNATGGSSGWALDTQRGNNGYRYCTTPDAGLSAKISFTGVAVYYQSPSFENESMQFSLDGDRTGDVDLSTPAGVRYNASTSRMVWSRTGLDNKEHTFELFPGSKTTTLNVDSVIITQMDVVSSVAATSTPATLATAASSNILSTAVSSTTKAALGIGITFGVVSFFVFLAIFFNLARRRRELNTRTGGKLPPPLPTPPSTFQNPSQGLTQTHLTTRPESPDSDAESEGRSVLGEEIIPQGSKSIRRLPSMPLSQSSYTAHAHAADIDYGMDESARAWSSPVPSTSGLIRAPSSTLSHGDVASYSSPAANVSRSGTAHSSKLAPLRRTDVVP